MVLPNYEHHLAMDLFQSFLAYHSRELLFPFKGWPLLSLVFLGLLTVSFYFKHHSKGIHYWLFLGSFPSLLWNSNRLTEWYVDVFTSLKNKGSFFIDGPILSKFCYFVTCHPQNLEYILKTNFNNFPKGSNYQEIFNALGDGIFNADFDSWRIQRKMAHAGFISMEFKTLVSNMSKKVVEEQLVPFLTHVAKQNSTIDLQDVCLRFSFDINISAIFGIHNERHLSIDLPTNQLANAIDEGQEAIYHRHTMPIFLWKLLHRLGVGREKNLAKAQKTVDVIFQKYITQKREDLLRGIETVDLLSSYIKSNNALAQSDVFLRDAMLSLFIAGRDTIASSLVWFLWVVSEHPSVESKILEELNQLLLSKDEVYEDKEWPRIFHSDDLKGLVYLHAALNESLRLYPPVPVNSKSVVREDLLPDGTVVKPGMQCLLSFYSVGRMPWIWGEDCLEFKPERWIDDQGKLIIHEHMSKFFAFNAGPRSCLGKDISYTQLKSAAATVLFNFHVQVLKGQDVRPKPFIVLHMKNGLMVNIKKRVMKC